MDMAINWPRPPAEGGAGIRPRAAEAVAPLALALPTGRSLPAPHERRRVRIPVAGDRLEPADDLAGLLRMLTA